MSEKAKGANSMSILKPTTTHLITRGGQTLSRIRDIIKSSLSRGYDTQLSSQLQSAGEFNPLNSEVQQQHVGTDEKLGVKQMITRLKTTKDYLIKAVGDYIVGVGRAIAGQLARAVCAVAVAVVMISAGSVVVPVSEAEADTINYQSTVTGSVSHDATDHQLEMREQ